MTTVTLAARYVTWVNQASPNVNYFGKSGYLAVDGSSSAGKQAILWFTPSFPATGANVLSASLRLRTRAIGAGSHSLTVRPAGKWLPRFGSVTWNNRPGLVGASSTVTKSGALPENTVWDFDVTATLQAVANGGEFWGLMVASTVAEQIMVQGAMGAALVPTLTVEWTEAPLPPGGLAPSSGRSVGVAAPVLRWTFYDHAGATGLRSIQVQLATSATGFGAPVWDSGVLASTVCSLDLAAAGYGGVASGGTVWWRVRNQDTAGLWSEWAAPTSFRFDPLPSVALVNPSPTTKTVTDPTPPIDWLFTAAGSPQARWRVGVYRLSGTRWVLAAASGEQVLPATSWTPPLAIGPAGRYKAIVDAFDGRQREATPGVATFVSASTEFTFAPSDVIVGVSNLMAVGSVGEPSVRLSWERAEQPDQWVVYRDGKVVLRADGSAWSLGGGKYGVFDRFVPEGPHTWTVYPFVNGVAGRSGQVVSKLRHGSTWLRDPDTGDMVRIIADTEHDMTLPEVTTVFEPLGASTVTVITSAQRGYEGTVQGVLAGASAPVWRDRMMAFKPDVGHRFELMIEDMVMPVRVWNVTVKGFPGYGGEAWNVSFNFAQVDDFPFDPIGF